MSLDTLAHADRYAAVHPLFARVRIPARHRLAGTRACGDVENILRRTRDGLIRKIVVKIAV